MWVSPKRRERGKGVWGVRPFLQEDRGSFAKRSHDDTYYIFDKSVISNNYYLCSARVSFNSPLVVEERPLLQGAVSIVHLSFERGGRLGILLSSDAEDVFRQVGLEVCKSDRLGALNTLFASRSGVLRG